MFSIEFSFKRHKLKDDTIKKYIPNVVSKVGRGAAAYCRGPRGIFVEGVGCCDIPQQADDISCGSDGRDGTI